MAVIFSYALYFVQVFHNISYHLYRVCCISFDREEERPFVIVIFVYILYVGDCQ